VIDFRNLLLPLAACSTAEGYFFSRDLSRRLAPSGGGECLCVVSGATINYVQQRFSVVHTTLALDSARSGHVERLLAIR
jgi:hypothetical protein